MDGYLPTRHIYQIGKRQQESVFINGKEMGMCWLSKLSLLYLHPFFDVDEYDLRYQ